MNALVLAAQPALRLCSLDIGTATTARGRQETVVATLEAQPRGFVAWVRRLAGFGRSVSLMLTTSRVIKMTRGHNSEESTSIPLSALSTVHYAYSRPVTKLVGGMLLAMFGLVGVFVVGPYSVAGLLVGGAITGWHFLTGPKLTLSFSGKDLTSLVVKVDARDSIQRLVQLAETAAEQLRIAEQAPAAAPPASPMPQSGFSARA